MPKTIFIPPDATRSGIDITWIKTSQRLDIGGWYDSLVCLENRSFELSEFFKELGITQKDCEKAFKR